MPQPLHVGVEVTDLGGEVSRALAEALDASGAAYVVLGPPSPTVAGTVLARRTRRIGVVVATSPQRDHPYNAARRVATLDWISGGRAGQLFLDRDDELGLGVGEGSVWADGAVGAEELADAVTASRKLWRTWPVETLVEGPAAYDHPIRYADHVGPFSTKGPLNVPTTPQGEPVVFWRLRSREVVADATAGAAVADVLLAEATDLDGLDPVGQVALGGVVGTSAQLHARLDVPVAEVASGIRRLAASPADVTGVVVALPARDVRTLAADVLPELAAGGVVQPPATGTLRARLGVPRREDPDLSGHPAAFAPLEEQSA